MVRGGGLVSDDPNSNPPKSTVFISDKLLKRNEDETKKRLDT